MIFFKLLGWSRFSYAENFYRCYCFENVSLHLVIVRNCWERCHRVDFSVLLWFNRYLNDIFLLLCQRVNHNLVSRFSHDCSFSAPQSYFHVCASNRCFVCSAIIQSSDLIASDEKDFWCWNICCRLAVLFKAGSAAVLSVLSPVLMNLYFDGKFSPRQDSNPEPHSAWPIWTGSFFECEDVTKIILFKTWVTRFCDTMSNRPSQLIDCFMPV